MNAPSVPSELSAPSALGEMVTRWAGRRAEGSESVGLGERLVMLRCRALGKTVGEERRLDEGRSDVRGAAVNARGSVFTGIARQLLIYLE